jgi:quercetin dioxygenase-like cupin family protein
MNGYKKLNLSEVKDLAPDFGMSEVGESRFAREALGAEGIGLAYYRTNPGRRLGFGHRHAQAEETYLILSGSGRFKVEDEIFDVGPRDVVYVSPEAMREWEAGDDGLEMVAFGGRDEEGGAEMEPGFWSD